MERLPDAREFEWIPDQLLPLRSSSDPAWSGNTVAHCVPATYEAYAKVLHAIRIDPGISDLKLTWQEAESLGLHPTIARGDRVLWRELAATYGLAFHPELDVSSFVRKLGGWPRRLVGPEEGRLEPEETSALAAILAGEGTPEIFLYWHSWANDVAADLLCQARLQEIPHAVPPEPRNSPSYWWPVDRAWCVCTDPDLQFTIVGGARRLVTRVLEAPALESVEVRPETRVDWRGDRMNGPSES